MIARRSIAKWRHHFPQKISESHHQPKKRLLSRDLNDQNIHTMVTEIFDIVLKFSKSFLKIQVFKSYLILNTGIFK